MLGAGVVIVLSFLPTVQAVRLVEPGPDDDPGDERNKDPGWRYSQVQYSNEYSARHLRPGLSRDQRNLAGPGQNVFGHDSYSGGVEESSDPFNCQESLSSWAISWSDDKKDWCCKHKNLGCSPDAYDCKLHLTTWEEDWSRQKKTWCCEHRNVGCAPDPFDCMDGIVNWVEGWSAKKKRWCCENGNVACEPVRYDCEDGKLHWAEAWSDRKKDYCCHERNVGCEAPPHDCSEGLAKWTEAWSDAKKQWCCDNEDVGCPGPRYECTTSKAVWQDTWSRAKREYCCYYENMGCEGHIAASGFDDDSYSARGPGQDAPGAHHHAFGDSAYDTHDAKLPDFLKDPFDCHLALSRWRSAWSFGKKQWCCQHMQLGCEDHQSEWENPDRDIEARRLHVDHIEDGRMADVHDPASAGSTSRRDDT